MSEESQSNSQKMLVQKLKFPNYVEVESATQAAIAQHYLFLFDRVTIIHDRGFTCPAKTLALFAHFDDFEYDAVPELVKEINACKEIGQVLASVRGGRLPKVARTSELEHQEKDAAKVCDVVFFDTKSQSRSKLICWVSIPR